MTEIFKIEKGIPLPAEMRGRPPGSTKYPFAFMEIGDSFLGSKTARTTAYRWAGRHPPMKFMTAPEGSQYRIWRTA